MPKIHTTFIPLQAQSSLLSILPSSKPIDTMQASISRSAGQARCLFIRTHISVLPVLLLTSFKRKCLGL